MGDEFGYRCNTYPSRDSPARLMSRAKLNREPSPLGIEREGASRIRTKPKGAWVLESAQRSGPGQQEEAMPPVCVRVGSRDRALRVDRVGAGT